MNTLAFDTATAACCVALMRGDGELFEHRPRTMRMFEQPAHATELLPAIVEVLERAGVDWSQVGQLAVGVGPGAFTGLRIGVATARAIATARGLQIAPVSSLAALQTGASSTSGARAVVPVIDARRGEFYHRLPGGDDDAGEDAVCGPDDLIGRAKSLVDGGGAPPLAVGDGAVKLRDRLEEAGLEVPPDEDPRHLVRASAVVVVAGEVEPLTPHDVVPNYIRPPDAKVSARERWLVGAGR